MLLMLIIPGIITIFIMLIVIRGLYGLDRLDSDPVSLFAALRDIFGLGFAEF